MTKTMVMISKLHEVAFSIGEVGPTVPVPVRRTVLNLLHRTADALTGGVAPYEESQALEAVADLLTLTKSYGLPPAEALIDELHELAGELQVMGADADHHTSKEEALTAIAGLVIAAEALRASVSEGEGTEADHAIEEMGKLALGEAL